MSDVDFLSKYADPAHAEFPTDAGMKLHIYEFKDTMTSFYKAEKDPFENIKDQVTVDIPFADKIDMSTTASNDSGSVKLSPISMVLKGSAKLYGKNHYGDAFDPKFSEGVDFLRTVKITYKEGTEYNVFNNGDENGKGGVASYAYMIGEKDSVSIMFNRLVDTNNISKITVNGIEFNFK